MDSSKATASRFRRGRSSERFWSSIAREPARAAWQASRRKLAPLTPRWSNVASHPKGAAESVLPVAARLAHTERARRSTRLPAPSAVRRMGKDPLAAARVSLHRASRYSTDADDARAVLSQPASKSPFLFLNSAISACSCSTSRRPLRCRIWTDHHHRTAASCRAASALKDRAVCPWYRAILAPAFVVALRRIAERLSTVPRHTHSRSN